MGSGSHVMTVTGPIEPSALGRTLMHEHLICDLTPRSLRGSTRAEVEISLANAFEVAYRPNDHLGNQRLHDLAVAIREAEIFRQAGGGAIVEMTIGGIEPDPKGLAEISRATGVHVVAGCGFYTEGYQDAATLVLSVEAIAEAMIRDLTEGLHGTVVRAGIIGEIGCSWPLTPFERRSLEAGAKAQAATGAAITVHPGRHPTAPHEILDILDAAGADLSRVIIDHMDRTYETDDGAVLALAKRGCVVEYDFFGIETSQYWMGVADLPNDWMRIRAIRKLFEAGLGKQVAVSHDICTRSRLSTYGGHGYAHLVSNGITLMRDRGFSDAEIDQLLVDTPRRLLTLPGAA
jgi:phosphotriesterase-related protein